jgi:hypothetical protein
LLVFSTFLFAFPCGLAVNGGLALGLPLKVLATFLLALGMVIIKNELNTVASTWITPLRIEQSFSPQCEVKSFGSSTLRPHHNELFATIGFVN